MTESEKKCLFFFNELNEVGKDKVLDYLNDISCVVKYSADVLPFQKKETIPCGNKVIYKN